MPKIYLSPSTQDWNMYVTGSGSEEYNMNLLADALVPYLLSNGIQYQRNRPERGTPFFRNSPHLPGSPPEPAAARAS